MNKLICILLISSLCINLSFEFEVKRLFHANHMLNIDKNFLIHRITKKMALIMDTYDSNLWIYKRHSGTLTKSQKKSRMNIFQNRAFKTLKLNSSKVTFNTFFSLLSIAWKTTFFRLLSCWQLAYSLEKIGSNISGRSWCI